MINVAINGFGRIGRLAFRILSEHKNVNIVAVNDLVPADNLGYLLKFDSTHGRFEAEVKLDGEHLVVDGKRTRVVAARDPAHLPWKDLDVDVVIESTGLFTKKEDAEKHLTAGAKRVILSAPSKSEGVPTFVMGVNHEQYKPEMKVISNASCTTNCLAPITKVLLDNFGIDEGLMTTIHAVTATQPTVDGPSHKDWRGGRGAMQNIIPASTGAAKAVALCLPEVKGKLTGMAFRVPVADVSAVDLTVKLSRPTDYAAICDAMKAAADGPMKGILGYCDEQVVSTDFIGDRHASIFDRGAGITLNPQFFKLVSWYDNESGYANSLVSLLLHIAKQA